MFDQFRATILRFWYQPLEEVELPAHTKGWVLRGGLGKELLNTSNQAYTQLFATPSPEPVIYWEKASQIPRPYVLDPPLESQTLYTPQDRICFNLILIGSSIEYLPYFVFAFYEFGRKGIGKRDSDSGKRGRCHLERVETLMSLQSEWSKLIFIGSAQRFCDSPHILEASALLEHFSTEPDRLVLEFMAPTRIQHEKKLVKSLTVEILFKSLWRRIVPLAIYHCGIRIADDPRELLQSAMRDVEIKAQSLDWRRVIRYSRRQDEQIWMDGFTGRVELEGNLKPYLLWLALGELVHVGEHTTFGWGKYRIH